MLQAVVAPARTYTAEDERTDAQRYFDAQMSKDHTAGSTSVMSVVAAMHHNPPAPPVGSWGFDHEKAAAIQAARQAQPMQKSAPVAYVRPSPVAQPVMVMPAQPAPVMQAAPAALPAIQHPTLRQAPWTLSSGGPDPHGMIASTGDTAGALAHIADVGVAMNQETQNHAQQSGMPVGAPAAVKVAPVNHALAQAEHLSDVRVVQQAVMQHEGVKTVKLVTAGSWKLDHGSTVGAASQRGAVAAAAPVQTLASNIPHAFTSALAAGVKTVAGMWSGDHSGQAASKMGGVVPILVPSQKLGTWTEDHGAVLKRKVKPSQAQLAIAASYSHTNDAEAVEAGFQAHGDRLRR